QTRSRGGRAERMRRDPRTRSDQRVRAGGENLPRRSAIRTPGPSLRASRAGVPGTGLRIFAIVGVVRGKSNDRTKPGAVARGEAALRGGRLGHYYREYFADRLGDPAAAGRGIDDARHQTLALEIFPFRRETIRALARILEIEPKDANAACLFGEILYSRARRD